MKRHAISHRGDYKDVDGHATPWFTARCIACEWTIEGDDAAEVEKAALEHSETEDDAPVTP